MPLANAAEEAVFVRAPGEAVSAGRDQKGCVRIGELLALDERSSHVSPN